MGRIDRVNELVKREISEIIHVEIQDPRVQFVTITAVSVSPDLRHARVSFSVLTGEKEVQTTLNGLNRAKGLIRKLLGKRVTMRYTPEIDFVYDKSVEYSAFIEEKLREIKNELNQDTQEH